jgi:hypothetical protein
MSDRKVQVTIGSSISVDPQRIQVKKHVEKVKWVNDDGMQFSVDIQGHPAPSCRADGNTFVCVSEAFTIDGVHKYSVSSPGKPILDPDIEVIP